MLSWLREPASETQITHGGRLWLYAIAVLIMAFLVIPSLIVIPMSFSESQYLEFPPREWSVHLRVAVRRVREFLRRPLPRVDHPKNPSGCGKLPFVLKMAGDNA